MMRLYRPRVKAISIVTMAVLCAFAKSEEERQVAITVDDLLYANGRDCDPQKILSITEALLKPLREARVSVVGLVVGADG
jgi:hypothetical protein